MCMDGLPEFMPVHHVHTVPVAAKRGCHTPGTEAMDCCELSYGCLGLNPGPLKEQ